MLDDRVLVTVVALAIFAVLVGMCGLLLWQIRLHRRELIFYAVILESRNEEIERQAAALTEVEAQIRELGHALEPPPAMPLPNGPRLVANGDVA